MSSPTSVHNDRYQIINNFKILHTFNNDIFLNSIPFLVILHCAAHARPHCISDLYPVSYYLTGPSGYTTIDLYVILGARTFILTVTYPTGQGRRGRRGPDPPLCVGAEADWGECFPSFCKIGAEPLKWRINSMPPASSSPAPRREPELLPCNTVRGDRIISSVSKSEK